MTHQIIQNVRLCSQGRPQLPQNVFARQIGLWPELEVVENEFAQVFQQQIISISQALNANMDILDQALFAVKVVQRPFLRVLQVM